MTGSARTIRSPSTLTSTRSTPCVAGCWGPALMTISSVWRPPVLERSGTGVRSSGTVPIRPAPRTVSKTCRYTAENTHRRPEKSPSSSQLGPGGCLFLVLRPRPGLVPATGQLEGAPQRVALEVFRQVELHEVGVAVEVDPEHLGALPLVPVGAAVERRQAGHGRALSRQTDMGDDGVAVGERGEGHEHLDASRLPVDGGQEVEVGAVELSVLLQDARRTHNVAGRERHVDRAVAHVHRGRRVGELAGDPAAKFLRIYPFP